MAPPYTQTHTDPLSPLHVYSQSFQCEHLKLHKGCYGARQASLKFIAVLLPQHPKRWDYRHEPLLEISFCLWPIHRCLQVHSSVQTRTKLKQLALHPHPPVRVTALGHPYRPTGTRSSTETFQLRFVKKQNKTSKHPHPSRAIARTNGHFEHIHNSYFSNFGEGQGHPGRHWRRTEAEQAAGARSGVGEPRGRDRIHMHGLLSTKSSCGEPEPRGPRVTRKRRPPS